MCIGVFENLHAGFTARAGDVSDMLRSRWVNRTRLLVCRERVTVRLRAVFVVVMLRDTTDLS